MLENNSGRLNKLIYILHPRSVISGHKVRTFKPTHRCEYSRTHTTSEHSGKAGALRRMKTLYVPIVIAPSDNSGRRPHRTIDPGHI